MSEDLIVQTNGPYLRVVLPDFEPDWAEVWSAIDSSSRKGSSEPRWSLPATQTMTASRACANWSSNWSDVAWMRSSSGRARRPSRTRGQSFEHRRRSVSEWR